MKGKASRILLLAKYFSHGLFDGVWWLLVLWVATIPLFTWFVRWDGRVVVWCGISQAPLSEAGSQEAMIHLLLGEYFCWGWVFVSFFYFLPNVLLPLAYSHAICHVLWFRMTPATRREIAIGRAFRLLLAATFLGVLSCSWFLVCIMYHKIGLGNFLSLMGGLFAHLAASCGFVLLFSQIANTNKMKTVLAYIGLLIPWLSGILHFIFQSQISFLDDWWPYAMPFAYVIEKDHRHMASTAMFGFLLILGYIAMQSGEIVLGINNSGSRGNE